MITEVMPARPLELKFAPQAMIGTVDVSRLTGEGGEA